MRTTPGRPPHVGILDLEVYLPASKVMQEAMEQQDGCVGKYTIGLGQVSMSFCDDREDPVSMALTAVHRLLEKTGVGANDIGRLEVGTESGLDRSKSIKSYVSALFAQAGNWSLEGVDSVHGCYAATAAVLNSVAWIESTAWDGRLAIVVATDVALYAPGSPARPTGGCGAVALLLGPDAPLALDPAWRATFSDHTEDFCKPVGRGSPYPLVDGPATLYHFLRAGDRCYANLRAALTRSKVEGAERPLARCQHFVSHSPFNKVVRKLLSRLHYQDTLSAGTQRQRQQPQPQPQPQPSQQAASSALGVAAEAHSHARLHDHLALGGGSPSDPAVVSSSQEPSAAASPPLPVSKPGNLPSSTDADPGALEASPLPLLDPDNLPCSSYADRALEKQLLEASAGVYREKAAVAAEVQQQVGNIYTGSLWLGLAGLVEREGPALAGKRVLLFSFGSGVMASLLGLLGRVPSGAATGAADRPRQVAGSSGLTATDGVSEAGTTVGQGVAVAATPAADAGTDQRQRQAGRSGPTAADGASATTGTTAGEDVAAAVMLVVDAGSVPPPPRFTLDSIACRLGLRRHILRQHVCSTEQYAEAAGKLERAYHAPGAYRPSGGTPDLEAGVYFLESVHEQGARVYRRKQ